MSLSEGSFRFSFKSLIELTFKNRFKIQKYSVTKSTYHLDIFPAYCGGPCTLLPSEYIKTGYEIAKTTNPGAFHHDESSSLMMFYLLVLSE